MQFRHVGKRIQCIRSIYNKNTKKCEQKQICSIPDTTTALPEPLGVLTNLSNQELNDLAMFLNNRNANIRLEKLKQLYENAPELLKDLSEIVKNNSDWINQEWVSLIWERTTLLQKSLKKSGFAKLQKSNSTEKKNRNPNRIGQVLLSKHHKQPKIKQQKKNKVENEPIKTAIRNQQSNNQEKAKQQKSIFAEYHTEIVTLLNADKTAKQIIEHLQTNYPNKANVFTYNGVRSYIRRNVKN